MQIYQVLYIKIHTHNKQTPHNKSKINKNMYCIIHMKWQSSFKTKMKQLHISHRT